MDDAQSECSAHAPQNSIPFLFPFDGVCDASRNGDVTLAFDEENPLKTHSSLLSFASPLLYAVIEQCKSDKVVHVGGDRRQTWTLLLHVIHPLGVSQLSKHFHKIAPCHLVRNPKKHGLVFKSYP